MEPDLLDVRLAVALELLRPNGPDFCLELLERVADNPLAAGDGNFAPGSDSKNTAVYGTKARSAISRPPA